VSRTIVSPAPPYRLLSDNAYEGLRDAILNGRLVPGERLVEAELARQMMISRAPIREAIRKLEQDGLVQYHARRGTVVRRLSAEEIRDVYHLRAHLEAYGARLAATNATLEELAKLENLLDRMREYAAQEDSPRVVSTDVEFHASICVASRSTRLFRLWDSLNPHSWTLLSRLKARYTLTEIAERHRPLLKALQARDPDLAASEISKHILVFIDVILAYLSEDSLAGREKPLDQFRADVHGVPGGIVVGRRDSYRI
jgi:DNA-binding GntR family transcriptional regulator